MDVSCGFLVIIRLTTVCFMAKMPCAEYGTRCYLFRNCVSADENCKRGLNFIEVCIYKDLYYVP